MGSISPQFCHCADIAPTVLEAVGIEAPGVVQGVEQLPIHGTSLAYTFDEPLAPVRKRVQYFELMGNRGVWADGWKAVTRHFKGTAFEDDRWELYHLDSDFSEVRGPGRAVSRQAGGAGRAVARGGRAQSGIAAR